VMQKENTIHQTANQVSFLCKKSRNYLN